MAQLGGYEELLEKVSSEMVLRKAVRGAAYGWSEECRDLAGATVRIPPEDISWDSVTRVCVLGGAYFGINRIMDLEGLVPGTYVHADCGWLILVRPEAEEIQGVLDRCGSRLGSLMLFNIAGLQLDLTVLERIEEIAVTHRESESGIRSLKGLQHLKLLSFAGCTKLAKLPPMEELPRLEALDLSECTGLDYLPDGIRSMKALHKLDLRDMELQDLPDWLPEIAEEISIDEDEWRSGKNKALVCLDGTAIAQIPNREIFRQPFEIVAKWFEERRKGRVQPLNEIKVVFLGDGEAGKSHTIARLMNDGGAPDHLTFDGQSTPGIVIRDKEYDLNGRKIRVHYWDFGGQEILHSMHRIFLTERTMYVVLLNARDNKQTDQARYWLHNIKSFAPEAPVMLVLNKIDQNENASVNESDLRGRYDKLTQILRLSALKYDKEEFNRAFTDKLLEEIGRSGFLDAQWPAAWMEVKKELENMSGPYINGEAYQRICDKYRVDDRNKDLLHWFNDLGVSFCCCDRRDRALKNYVILRPNWIANALYVLLFNKLEGAANGLVPHDAIYDLLENSGIDPSIRCTEPGFRYNGVDIQFVLGVMRKFNLSFAHGTMHEFIPMLCTENSPVDAQYYRRSPDSLEFNMEFDYLPNNLLHRLMVERRRELDLRNVWRTGAKFRMPELGYSAVVIMDGNLLQLLIQHSNPMHRPNTYLTMLKADVDWIVQEMGLKPPECKLVYKLDGKRDEFDYDMLKLLQEVGQLQAISPSHRRMIPIADILNQSAPERLHDEMRLLKGIRSACWNLQGESQYWLKKKLDGSGYENGKGMEDLRNRRVRDDLGLLQFRVCDQTQRGISSNGVSIGELDMLLLKEHGEPWTIIEALRVSDGSKTAWNEHMDRLIGRYNFFGAGFLYLLTYVDADPGTFANIWDGYRQHLRGYHPGLYRYLEDSFTDLSDESGSANFKAAKCRYSSGGDPVTVYHIFARIPTENR